VSEAGATAWWLYLVRTGSGSLYTGISTDPERRLREHRDGGRGARALRGRGPLELAFVLPVADRGEASRLEFAVKRLDRRGKEAVVAGRLDPRSLLASGPGPAAEEHGEES
jgi:putative endonuclease